MQGKPLAARIAEIGRIQTEQGYMADVAEENGAYVLTEHNCAVCRVAAQHDVACREELTLFRELLGPDVTVRREKHLLAGDHVCAFRIAPVGTSAPKPGTTEG